MDLFGCASSLWSFGSWEGGAGPRSLRSLVSELQRGEEGKPELLTAGDMSDEPMRFVQPGTERSQTPRTSPKFMGMLVRNSAAVEVTGRALVGFDQ